MLILTALALGNKYIISLISMND